MIKYLTYSGVYAIKCLVNDRWYIGASSRLDKRLQRHRNLLRTNSHFNRSLQEDFSLYGFNSFEFVILEYTNNLQVREEYWIEKEKEHLYNVWRDGKWVPNERTLNRKVSPRQSMTEEERKIRSEKLKGIKKSTTINYGTEFHLIGPDGSEYKGKNLALFCRENNLSINGIAKVRDGYRNSWRGWKVVNSKVLVPVEYEELYLVNENEEEIGPINNIGKFCREMLFNEKNFRNMLKGKAKSYRGWKIK